MLKRSKSLRNSVLLLLLLCVLRLFTVPLVLPSSAGVDPTAHIIVLCASALPARCGHRACPAPRDTSYPTAHVIILSYVLRYFLSRCVHRACPVPRDIS